MDNYLLRAETALIVTTLLYFLMNGAQVFETAVLVPKWTAAPPDSFQVLKGKYPIDLKKFWIITHSIHEISFIAAIIFCWDYENTRLWLLILFAIHFAVRVWTLAYFAPKIIAFQRMEGSIPGLAAKARMWRNLNYIRVGLFILISIALLPVCSMLMSRSAPL